MISPVSKRISEMSTHIEYAINELREHLGMENFNCYHSVVIRRALRHLQDMENILEAVAELERDEEHQKFRLTRFQVAQLARGILNQIRTEKRKAVEDASHT